MVNLFLKCKSWVEGHPKVRDRLAFNSNRAVANTNLSNINLDTSGICSKYDNLSFIRVQFEHILAHPFINIPEANLNSGNIDEAGTFG